MARWTLTIRDGPQVRKAHHETLDAALADLEQAIDQIAPDAHRDEVTFLRRKIAPVAQVAARLEIVGPQRFVPAVQGGVDLRGDGSAEAYTGRWRRRLIDPEQGENAIAALARTLHAKST